MIVAPVEAGESIAENLSSSIQSFSLGRPAGESCDAVHTPAHRYTWAAASADARVAFRLVPAREPGNTASRFSGEWGQLPGYALARKLT